MQVFYAQVFEESISSICTAENFPPAHRNIHQADYELSNVIEGVSKLGLSFEGKEVVLGAHLREPRELRQGLLGPARWVTREVLAVSPMVFPTRREAAHNFCYNLCVKGLLCWYGLLACDGSRTAS